MLQPVPELVDGRPQFSNASGAAEDMQKMQRLESSWRAVGFLVKLPQTSAFLRDFMWSIDNSAVLSSDLHDAGFCMSSI